MYTNSKNISFYFNRGTKLFLVILKLVKILMEKYTENNQNDEIVKIRISTQTSSANTFDSLIKTKRTLMFSNIVYETHLTFNLN